ncbi:DNA replication and repair protein RecN [Granulicatella balaenopterae]|uniref:DNA repair protein RecN n=1 Tax=Granulicatella balaenopterae TaxID=137733 RepID=A0A1H9GQS1_9LACT|nr:DNA repair protein RecN [Granulicatella balaenopterae]SEQ52421.1 DNA replication and repair protein RecN [Granulicatella balaenopterae]
MIQELYIKNFAIIEEIHCQFDDGMTVLTGETGAGKSIIIDAVGLLLGERASIDMIRFGEDKAVIQGLFLFKDESLKPNLASFGIDVPDRQLLVQRELYRNGKSSCRVNGQLCTVSILKQVMNQMVDIHGQNEHFLLLNPQKHVDLIDLFAFKEINPLKEQYEEVYQSYRSLQRELQHQLSAGQQEMQRLDLLKFQIDEIQQANLELGEEEKLSEEKNYFTHYQKIQQALQLTSAILEGEEAGVLDQVAQAMNAMQSIESIDEEYQAISQQLQDAYYQLQDVISSVHADMDNASFDEERFKEIEERLDIYYHLKRKYGVDAEAILAYLEEIQLELDQVEHRDDYIAQLTNDVAKKHDEAVSLAEELAVIRKKYAGILAQMVEHQLKDLYMPHAKFEVNFEALKELGEHGLNQIEFYLSTNTGEPLKPLAKIASGGELSRITLALKTIFVKEQVVSTVIFDEIDTGVSGRVAQAIAEKMQYVSEFAQVLCITHLPQVSSMANHQYRIQKEEQDGRTRTKLVLLSPEERVAELARMSSGEVITELSMEHARELLTIAENSRQKNNQLKLRGFKL